MKKNSVYCIAWISTAIAVSVAVFVTRSAAPLLGLLVPAVIMEDSKE